MIDVVNLQRKIKLDSSVFRGYLQQLSSFVDEANGKTFSVAFVSDKRMTALNKFFRGKDSTTDVLSFPRLEPGMGSSDQQYPITTVPGSDKDFLGDIVISVEQAERQAKENRLSNENEIKQLILHGLLHLCGHDHETDNGEMNRRELELRDKLGI
jgi:probable rRNA maturation factor